MITITITDQQARDLLFGLDYHILELEAQKANAAKAGQSGRAHVLNALIESYNHTYHEVNAALGAALEKGDILK